MWKFGIYIFLFEINGRSKKRRIKFITIYKCGLNSAFFLETTEVLLVS